MKLTLIVKPTQACNANCVYCSVADKEKKPARMTEEVLEALFRRIAEYLEQRPADEVQITWHGGEPLLMGPDFYVAAHDLQQSMMGPNARRVHHAFQTNLTLFNDSFAEVFRLLGVRSIGSSYESYEGLRRLGASASAGSYDRLFFRGLRALERIGIPAGLIYVVTSLTLPRPAEALLFAANLVTDRARAGVRFNRLYREGEANKGEHASLAVSGEQFGHFLGAVFSYWLPRRHVLPDVEPCTSLRDELVERRACAGCEDSGACGTTHLGIDPDGKIYQCGRSLDAGILCFGTLHDNDFINVFDHPAKRLLNERSGRLAETECAGCRFFSHCHGGCPVDGHREAADFMKRGGICAAKRIFLGEYVEPLMGVTFSSNERRTGVDVPGIPS
jgi:uncharacterized protein